MKRAGEILEGIDLVWWPTILRSLGQGEDIDGGGTQLQMRAANCLRRCQSRVVRWRRFPAKGEFRQMLADETANATPDIEELAGMLTRGEFPENYDSIIRNISDEDLERLWATF